MARPTNKEIRYRNVGRPSKMTEEVIGKLEEALKMDCTVGMACSYAGIHESTYYDHYKDNQSFADRMDSAEKYLHLVAHQQRAKKINEGEWDAIKEFKKKRDERYKDKQDIDTKADLTVDLSKASLEELWKIARGGK